ncbi:Dyp-type peroxidase domain-containing protein [Dyadobacter sp. 3J3]|uniref:Dyp-type peroxidase n=1 Tax=Dyadobacter sp. 3J3 TaxID=2606600 RepID=UPI00135C3CDB|nr:Dyp-type peroxidase domain-containing protein [Dyadobacter sp. 3J3]
MKKHDFLICTFKGDVTVYVAEILNVFQDRFDCRFVHSESLYTFSQQTWTVLKTTGAFPVGTPLTSHELYTESTNPPTLNSFTSVTFANGKSYLGRIITVDPLAVRFLHKGIPVYVFENKKIISSGGVYPRGQAILDAKPFALAGNPLELQPIDLSRKGISYNGADFSKIAPEIQGNIVKSHGRDHTSHIFFQFNAGKTEDAKKFIKEFALTRLTSALKQKQDSDKITTEKKLARQENREPRLEALQTLFISLMLSSKGYAYLHQDTTDLEADFNSGMKKANDSSFQMFDVPVENWEAGYQKEIHGMILIGWGGKTREALDAETSKITDRLKANNLATILTTEKGDAITNANNDHIEHFGYVDGVSQPKFFNEELSELKDNGVQTVHWNPLMPLDLVLIKDSRGKSIHAYGSYFVFRKLEQDVNGFRNAVVDLAGELFNDPGNDQFDLTGAMIVGRFKNGVPVTISSSNKKIGTQAVNNTLAGKINDFNYDSDADGAKCPFHAHIRKTNPRTSSTAAQSEEEKRHMMARRGISYGKPSEEKVGLLFMSFQSSIFQQFQHQQEVFANADEHGKDPIIGQGEFADQQQKYARTYNDKKTIEGAKSFNGFVTLKGGEYFFAPSISFLTSIQ